IARADRSTTGVTVSEEFEHTKAGRRSIGHRASASMSIRLTDTDTIGRLIMRATGELDARIAGPNWRISTDNPAWLEAATQAAAPARAKAAAYATGTGRRLGAVISLPELDHGRPMHMPMMARAAAAAAPDIDVEAGDQDVVATVTATFALES